MAQLDWIMAKLNEAGPFTPPGGPSCFGDGTRGPVAWLVRTLEDVSYQEQAPGLDKIDFDRKNNKGGSKDPARIAHRVSVIRAAWNWVWLCIKRARELTRQYNSGQLSVKPSCWLDDEAMTLLAPFQRVKPPILRTFNASHGRGGSQRDGTIMISNRSEHWGETSGSYEESLAVASTLVHEIGHHSEVMTGQGAPSGGLFPPDPREYGTDADEPFGGTGKGAENNPKFTADQAAYKRIHYKYSQIPTRVWGILNNSKDCCPWPPGTIPDDPTAAPEEIPSGSGDTGDEGPKDLPQDREPHLESPTPGPREPSPPQPPESKIETARVAPTPSTQISSTPSSDSGSLLSPVIRGVLPPVTIPKMSAAVALQPERGSSRLIGNVSGSLGQAVELSMLTRLKAKPVSFR